MNLEKFKTLIYKTENRVATITLNVPEKKNAMDVLMMNELEDVMAELKYNDDIGAIIIAGSGDSFCAGGDIKGMKEKKTSIEGRNLVRKLHEWLGVLFTIEKPVIASVNGPAIGAGFSMALAADLIVASELAVFGAPFKRVGLIPDAGCLYLLPRYVGLLKAKEIIFSGRLIEAEEARKLGLIHKVVSKDNLIKTTTGIAKELAEGPLPSLGMAKRIINLSFETGFFNLLDYEAFAQAIAFQTEDHEEGVKAFLEKREPKFCGR